MHRPSPISGILIAIVYFETIELNIDTKKYLDQDITRQGTHPFFRQRLNLEWYLYGYC